MGKKPILLIPKPDGYAEWLSDLKSRISIIVLANWM